MVQQMSAAPLHRLTFSYFSMCQASKTGTPKGVQSGSAKGLCNVIVYHGYALPDHAKSEFNRVKFEFGHAKFESDSGPAMFESVRLSQATLDVGSPIYNPIYSGGDPPLSLRKSVNICAMCKSFSKHCAS
eukprot:922685-Pelagomonas_calceolata.AAC.4